MARRVKAWAILSLLGIGMAPPALGQGPASNNPNQLAAKVERAPLGLVPPDRYRVPSVLEPSRKVTLMAPADGVLRTVSVPVGATVREGQEIARLDPAGAMARLKIAMAQAKEAEAEMGLAKRVSVGAGGQSPGVAINEARVEAARARVDLAQMEVDACTLRAPFAGRVVSQAVYPGQYLAKGSTILEVADVSILKVLLPVDRTAVAVGASVNFTIEGYGASGKATAVLPLGESQSTLRELAAPLAGAWITLANPAGTFEPGQRAQSPYLPNAPIAGVPTYSMGKNEAGSPIVQVIRAERVTDVPVRVVGILGPDRTQVSGPFRPSDVLIQSTSLPLRAGTFIRFNDAPLTGRVEGQLPSADLVGDPADVTPPPGIAPIGSGGRPRPAPSRPASAPPATPKSATPASGSVPF